MCVACLLAYQQHQQLIPASAAAAAAQGALRWGYCLRRGGGKVRRPARR
jgi:hypothetical protein